MLTSVLNVQRPGGYSVYAGSRSMLRGGLSLLVCFVTWFIYLAEAQYQAGLAAAWLKYFDSSEELPDSIIIFW